MQDSQACVRGAAYAPCSSDLSSMISHGSHEMFKLLTVSNREMRVSIDAFFGVKGVVELGVGSAAVLIRGSLLFSRLSFRGSIVTLRGS